MRRTFVSLLRVGSVKYVKAASRAIGGWLCLAQVTIDGYVTSRSLQRQPDSACGLRSRLNCFELEIDHHVMRHIEAAAGQGVTPRDPKVAPVDFGVG